jgi:hypothetical protein
MRWKSFDQPFGDDAEQSLNDEFLSRGVLAVIERYSIERVHGPFLGLAAGEARAELDLARALGIQDVTLVDKHPVDLPHFEGNYVDAEMLNYIENNQGRRFGIITLFGVEYVLENRANWARLTRGLDGITTMGSIIAISPEPQLELNEGHYTSLFKTGFYVAQRTS